MSIKETTWGEEVKLFFTRIGRSLIAGRIQTGPYSWRPCTESTGKVSFYGNVNYALETLNRNNDSTPYYLFLENEGFGDYSFCEFDKEQNPQLWWDSIHQGSTYVLIYKGKVTSDGVKFVKLYENN